VVALNSIVRFGERGNSIGAFPLASAPLRQTKTEIFSLHFLFFSAPHFFAPGHSLLLRNSPCLLIGNEKFSVLVSS